MNPTELIPNETYLLVNSKGPIRQVKFVRDLGQLNAVLVKRGHGQPFLANAAQLNPLPINPRTLDPDGLSPAERTLLDLVLAHPGLNTQNLAAIVNGDPDRNPKWNAGIVGGIGRKLEKAGKVVLRRVSGENLMTIDLK